MADWFPVASGLCTGIVVGIMLRPVLVRRAARRLLRGDDPPCPVHCGKTDCTDHGCAETL